MATSVGFLPVPLSSFVGRQHERRKLAELLRASRLLTICGAPGVGKSRLALETAADMSLSGGGNTWWVALAPVVEGTQVVQELASVLGIQDHGNRGLSDSVIDYLRGRPTVIVLDNCEHVIPACAALIDRVLRHCPDLTVIATSREPLALTGERVWSAPPLSLTDAVQLFRARAADAGADDLCGPDSRRAIADVCRYLDGLPLAIELAAARAGVLSPAEMATRLARDRLEMLGDPGPHAGARHDTLRSALEWSYRLLNEAERALIRRVTVFSGGFTLAAAEAVCGADLNTLSSLVAKSLVGASTAGGHTRYGLLQTVRAFAAESLVGSEEAEVRNRHLSWYIGVAEAVEAELTGAHQRVVSNRVEVEYANLVTAFGWAMREEGQCEALRLAAAMVLWWRARGWFAEGHEWLVSALRRCSGAPTQLRARGLWGASFMALMIEDRPAAVSLADESLRIYTNLKDDSGRGRALLLIGNAVMIDNPPVLALPKLQEAAALARRVDDHWCLSHALSLISMAKMREGDHVAAGRAVGEAVAIARLTHDLESLGFALDLLGRFERSQGRQAEAEVAYGESLAINTEMNNAFMIGSNLLSLGTLAVTRGDLTRAKRLYHDGLRQGRRAGSGAVSVLALCQLGAIAHGEGDTGTARRLYEEALSRSDDTFSCMALQGLGLLAISERDLPVARRHLEAALALARSHGAGAVAAALLHDLGNVARLDDDFPSADDLYLEALSEYARCGQPPEVADTLEATAGIAARTGRAERAARLVGAAQTVRCQARAARDTYRCPFLESDLADMREHLPGDRFDAAVAQGAAMAADEAISYATRGRGRRRRSPSGWHSLTDAERRVALLVVEGLTNPEIAERLFVTRSTIRNHLHNVFTKLGISSRVELAVETSGRLDGAPAEDAAK